MEKAKKPSLLKNQSGSGGRAAVTPAPGHTDSAGRAGSKLETGKDAETQTGAQRVTGRETVAGERYSRQRRLT